MIIIYMGSSQDLKDTVAHYRHKIYSIIHTEKAVRSLYEESFKSYLPEGVEKPVIRSQRKEIRPKFAWQSHTSMQPQMLFMGPMYKPLQIPGTTNHISISSKLSTRDQMTALTTKSESKEPVAPESTSGRLVNTPSTLSTSLSARQVKSEASDWSKSFETLQTKRSQFVNSSTPRFEETIPLYATERSKSPNKAIRHYSFYMPDVEIDDDGRISVKGRASTPECDQSDSQDEEESEHAVAYHEHNVVNPAEVRASIYPTEVAFPHFFEFGIRSDFAVCHRAFTDLRVIKSRKKLQKDQTAETPLLEVVSEEAKKCQTAAVKKVIFSDQLESIQMIPGRHHRRKTKSKRNLRRR